MDKMILVLFALFKGSACWLFFWMEVKLKKTMPRVWQSSWGKLKFTT